MLGLELGFGLRVEFGFELGLGVVECSNNALTSPQTVASSNAFSALSIDSD